MNNSHKTAIVRKKLSLPMRWILRNFYETGDFVNGLDFGCGRGYDAKALGFDGYDPKFAPWIVNWNYKTITCNYVFNVIPSVVERDKALGMIMTLLRNGGKAFISIRNDRKALTGYKSGGTWQGYVGNYLRSRGCKLLKSTANFEIYYLTKSR